MSLSIDLKFTLLISNRFEKFQRKSDYLFNCRCPLCGDSQKNKNKMRGYIYRKGNDLFYKCHNCGTGTTIGNLIKNLDSNLHKEYTLERYKSGEINSANTAKQVFKIDPVRFGKVEKKDFEYAERCDYLPDEHFCKKYLHARKIPREAFSKLFFTPNYKQFCDTAYPNHDKEITPDARLVIPFYDKYNALIGISGRALTTADNKLRYITLKTNDSENKLIYGLDNVNFSETVKIVEGPIDSLFLDNCVASGDSSLSITAKLLPECKKVLIFDNEPRNKEIVKLMHDAIKLGHDVVIWPSNIKEKDINEMVINGLSVDEIESIISKNTFNGLEAQLKYVFWKKV